MRCENHAVFFFLNSLLIISPSLISKFWNQPFKLCCFPPFILKSPTLSYCPQFSHNFCSPKPTAVLLDHNGIWSLLILRHLLAPIHWHNSIHILFLQIPKHLNIFVPKLVMSPFESIDNGLFYLTWEPTYIKWQPLPIYIYPFMFSHYFFPCVIFHPHSF